MVGRLDNIGGTIGLPLQRGDLASVREERGPLEQLIERQIPLRPLGTRRPPEETRGELVLPLPLSLAARRERQNHVPGLIEQCHVQVHVVG